MCIRDRYYLGLFIQIDLRAVKKGLKGLPNVTRIPVRQLLAEGWLYLAALGILMYGLFFLYLRPEVAALYALGTLIVLGSVSKRTRQGLTGLLTILRTTGRGMLEITVIGAAAGIVIGVGTIPAWVFRCRGCSPICPAAVFSCWPS